jgi:ubiquinone/menaquinone biosynthesis C-methylase UbiE
MEDVARQNVYDDESFFMLYQAMREAQTGINEAVEQPALRGMLPRVTGAAVIDLGCGDGQLSRDLVVLGAASVLGIDPSERMLALAQRRTTDHRVRYLRAFAEDAWLPEASADLVVSSLALHYVADFDGVMVRIAEWLRQGAG